MKHPGGHPIVKPERMAWALRFELTERQKRTITDKVCEQLSMCKDDQARRLLLGIKEES